MQMQTQKPSVNRFLNVRVCRNAALQIHHCYQFPMGYDLFLKPFSNLSRCECIHKINKIIHNKQMWSKL